MSFLSTKKSSSSNSESSAVSESEEHESESANTKSKLQSTFDWAKLPGLHFNSMTSGLKQNRFQDPFTGITKLSNQIGQSIQKNISQVTQAVESTFSKSQSNDEIPPMEGQGAQSSNVEPETIDQEDPADFFSSIDSQFMNLGTSINSEWSSLINSVGTIKFKAKPFLNTLKITQFGIFGKDDDTVDETENVPSKPLSLESKPSDESDGFETLPEWISTKRLVLRKGHKKRLTGLLREPKSEQDVAKQDSFLQTFKYAISAIVHPISVDKIENMTVHSAGAVDLDSNTSNFESLIQIPTTSQFFSKRYWEVVRKNWEDIGQKSAKTTMKLLIPMARKLKLTTNHWQSIFGSSPPHSWVPFLVGTSRISEAFGSAIKQTETETAESLSNINPKILPVSWLVRPISLSFLKFLALPIYRLLDAEIPDPSQSPDPEVRKRGILWGESLEYIVSTFLGSREKRLSTAKLYENGYDFVVAYIASLIYIVKRRNPVPSAVSDHIIPIRACISAWFSLLDRVIPSDGDSTENEQHHSSGIRTRSLSISLRHQEEQKMSQDLVDSNIQSLSKLLEHLGDCFNIPQNKRSQIITESLNAGRWGVIQDLKLRLDCINHNPSYDVKQFSVPNNLLVRTDSFLDSNENLDHETKMESELIEMSPEERAQMLFSEWKRDERSQVLALLRLLNPALASQSISNSTSDKLAVDILTKFSTTEISEGLGNLYLKIIKAVNLPAADETGFSDPYCLLSVGLHGSFKKKKKMIRTDTIKQTLNPEWNSEFNFMIRNEDFAKPEIVIQIWDEDEHNAGATIKKLVSQHSVQSDDYLGLVIIPFDLFVKHTVRTVWIPVNSPKKSAFRKFAKKHPKTSLDLESLESKSSSSKGKPPKLLVSWQYVGTIPEKASANTKSLTSALIGFGGHLIQSDIHNRGSLPNYCRHMKRLMHTLLAEDKSLSNIDRWILNEFTSRYGIRPIYPLLEYCTFLASVYEPTRSHLHLLFISTKELFQFDDPPYNHLTLTEIRAYRTFIQLVLMQVTKSLSNYYVEFPRNRPEGALSICIDILSLIVNHPVTHSVAQEMEIQLSKNPAQQLMSLIDEAIKSTFKILINVISSDIPRKTPASFKLKGPNRENDGFTSNSGKSAKGKGRLRSKSITISAAEATTALPDKNLSAFGKVVMPVAAVKKIPHLPPKNQSSTDSITRISSSNDPPTKPANKSKSKILISKSVSPNLKPKKIKTKTKTSAEKIQSTFSKTPHLPTEGRFISSSYFKEITHDFEFPSTESQSAWIPFFSKLLEAVLEQIRQDKLFFKDSFPPSVNLLRQSVFTYYNFVSEFALHLFHFYGNAMPECLSLLELFSDFVDFHIAIESTRVSGFENSKLDLAKLFQPVLLSFFQESSDRLITSMIPQMIQQQQPSPSGNWTTSLPDIFQALYQIWGVMIPYLLKWPLPLDSTDFRTRTTPQLVIEFCCISIIPSLESYGSSLDDHVSDILTNPNGNVDKKIALSIAQLNNIRGTQLRTIDMLDKLNDFIGQLLENSGKSAVEINTYQSKLRKLFRVAQKNLGYKADSICTKITSLFIPRAIELIFCQGLGFDKPKLIKTSRKSISPHQIGSKGITVFTRSKLSLSNKSSWWSKVFIQPQKTATPSKQERARQLEETRLLAIKSFTPFFEYMSQKLSLIGSNLETMAFKNFVKFSWINFCDVFLHFIAETELAENDISQLSFLFTFLVPFFAGAGLQSSLSSESPEELISASSLIKPQLLTLGSNSLTLCLSLISRPTQDLLDVLNIHFPSQIEASQQEIAKKPKYSFLHTNEQSSRSRSSSSHDRISLSSSLKWSPNSKKFTPDVFVMALILASRKNDPLATIISSKIVPIFVNSAVRN